MFATTSLNGLIGHAALIIGLAACAFGALALVIATTTGDTRLLRSIANYAWLALGGAVVAVAVMERALITRDFSLAYIQQVGSRDTPALFNVTALWSALEGSILLWLLILAIYTAVIMRRYRRRLDDPLVAWALVVMFIVTAFFFFLSFGPIDAFKGGPIPDFNRCCLGPNPLLQNHILVLFHPPILYLGYVGFTVPFAFAIAALITGRVGEGWLVATRRWALYAWGFLTVGIILGGWWSYEVLGWGGVWGWDPVENASFLPWLTATVYIHSVMVQERRGMLRVWNISLLVATFSLTILGTFITRSGVLRSVHAFSNGTIGPYLLGFFGLIVVVSLALIAWRGDRLRSPGAIDSPVSREGAFLANNVIFTVFAFIVLLGTVFPLIVEALQDRQIAVGPPFFDRLSMPIGITLLFLMAVAPVLPWRKASTELLRDRLFWPAWCGAGALGDQRARRRRRVCAIAGVLPRWLRRWCSDAPTGAGRSPPGLAGPGRKGKRRDGGAPRGDHHRRRPGGLEQLHPGRRVHPEAGRTGRVRRAHVRAGQVAAVHRRPLDRCEGVDPCRRRQDVRPGDHDVHELRHRRSRPPACATARSTTSTSRCPTACASTAPRRPSRSSSNRWSCGCGSAAC